MVAATPAHALGLPVLAGILLPDTSAVIRRAEQAVVLGVDGVAVTTPFGAEITQERIYQHYAAIRMAVEIPLFQGWEHLLLAAGDVAGFIGPLTNPDPELCNRMLTEPDEQRQVEIYDACSRYVHADDRYRSVKAEFVHRGVLDTDRVVPASAEPVAAREDNG